MRSETRLVEVELVEDVGDEGRPTPADPWLRPLVARAVARTPRWAWAAAAAVVVAAVGAWLIAQGMAAAARDARLARTEGLSVSLAQPLTEGWRAPGFGVLAVVDDAVLLNRPIDGGVTAVDERTGEERYTLQGACSLVVEDESQDPGFPEGVRVQDGDLVMCVHGPPGLGHLVVGGDDIATVAVHDPGSGALLRSFTLPAGAHPWPVDRSAVALAHDRDGHVLAERWSLLTGERMWSYRSTAPMSITTGAPWVSGRDGDVLRLSGDGWGATVDLTTGEELGTTSGLEVPDFEYDLADGTTVRVRTGTDDGNQESTVTGPDGRVRFTASGQVVDPAVDDGTAGGTLFLTEGYGGTGRLVAVDAASGRERWSADAAGGYEFAVLSGVLVAVSDSGITAVDASSGEVRWATSTLRDEAAAWGMVTDGRRLLTVEREDSTSWLVARDAGTGDPVWREALPVATEGGFVALSQLPDGTVVVSGADELVAMRP